jgi:MoaA/NifB/PqqE/SkfB family radical SAM enzyme
MSDTYCPLPWNHFSAHTDGSMRVCCNSTNVGKLKDNNNNPINLHSIENIIEFYNIDHLKNIRKKMLLGERIPECTRCYDIEDNNGTSVRQTFIKKWPIDSYINNTDQLTGEIKKVDINYLDLSWSNKCNLQCKMCSPAASDQLLPEFIEINGKNKHTTLLNLIDFKDQWQYSKIKSILSQTISNNLNEILVTGGEPLINNDFYEFCKSLIKSGISTQISISIHTNLTVLPTKWFDIWPKFKTTSIKISLDGVEDVYEYIRYPGKWHIVKQNIEKLITFSRDKKKFGIEFHTVLSIFNTSKFTDLLDYISKLDEKCNIIRIPHINYIYDPIYASPSNIPEEYKLKIYNEINTWVDNNRDKFINDRRCLDKLDVLIAVSTILLDSSENNIQQSYEYIKKMDDYRKHDTSKFLPWIK